MSLFHFARLAVKYNPKDSACLSEIDAELSRLRDEKS